MRHLSFTPPPLRPSQLWTSVLPQTNSPLSPPLSHSLTHAGPHRISSDSSRLGAQLQRPSYGGSKTPRPWVVDLYRRRTTISVHGWQLTRTYVQTYISIATDQVRTRSPKTASEPSKIPKRSGGAAAAAGCRARGLARGVLCVSISLWFRLEVAANIELTCERSSCSEPRRVLSVFGGEWLSGGLVQKSQTKGERSSLRRSARPWRSRRLRRRA